MSSKMTKFLMVLLNILLSREKWAVAKLDSSSTYGPCYSSTGYPPSSSFGTYCSSKSDHWSFDLGYSSSFGSVPRGDSSITSTTSCSSKTSIHSTSSFTDISSPSSAIPCKPDRCGLSISSSLKSTSPPSPTSSSSSSMVSPSYSPSSSSSVSYKCVDIEDDKNKCSCGPIRNPRSCLELKQRGFNSSGVYSIAPCDQRPCDVVEVYCDMDTDGGGWTVFQNRGKDTEVKFNRDFNSYRYGFGSAKTDYWLGNEYIHCLTSHTYTELMVNMKDWCNKNLTEYYHCFFVSDWNSRFELRLKNLDENSITDSLMPHSNVKFSTYDRDTCNRRASQLGGGWWHTAPHSNLNGVYNSQEDSSYCCREMNSLMSRGNSTRQSCKTNGIFWRKWHGITYSLKNTTMMLRGRSTQDNPASLKCYGIDTGFCDAKPVDRYTAYLI